MKSIFKTTTKRAIIIMAALCIYGCTSSVQVLKPHGDSAEITLLDQTKHEGELISIADRSIIMANENKIVDYRINDIDRLRIEGYSLLQKKSVFMGVLSIYDIFSLYSTPTNSMKVIYGLLAIGKLTSILGGDPEVVFTNPIFFRDLDKVRLHCRYPQGLEPDQWKQLLELYGQDEILKTRSKIKK